MAGLLSLFTREARPAPVRERAIDHYAIVDGFATDGSDQDGWDQHYRRGMRIPGAWRCALLLSDLIGSVPWDDYRRRPGEPDELLDRPLLLEQPAWPDTLMTTFSSLALDLIWEGNAVAVVASRNREGWPTGIVPVPCRTVGVRRIRPTADPMENFLGPIEYRVGNRIFPVDDVIHIKGPCAPGALRGMSVLEAHFATLKLARDQQEQAGDVSQHGVPTGILKVTNPDATRGDLKGVKAGWLANQARRTIQVINATTEFEPIAWNPEEMQLVEARKFTLHEVALIFGVPLSFLGVEQTSRTYTNVEQEALNLLKFSLRGHLARFEQTLSTHLPRGHEARADLDDILRADTFTRYQAYQLGIASKWLTADEVRLTEGRPPLTAAQKAELAPPPPAAPAAESPAAGDSPSPAAGDSDPTAQQRGD